MSTARPKAKASSGANRTTQPATQPKLSSGESAGDWRAATLEKVRRLIHEADPEIVEERKWVKPGNPSGVPVWSHDGIVCTGETYKQTIKLTFPRGASLEDPRGLFNSSLDGAVRRAIDIREGEDLDGKAFKALIRAAVEENLRAGAPRRGGLPKAGGKAQAKTGGKAGPKAGPKVRPRAGETSAPEDTQGRRRIGGKAEPTLLSGGNPQVAKAEGDAPVQAYIAAMPGWKRDIGKRLDALIVRSVPDVGKAVKWNSPFYGIEGQGWFLSFHVFTRYVKVTFFQGASLRPVPPGGTGKDPRWIDIHEDDFEEAQMVAWVKQAAALPGWMP